MTLIVLLILLCLVQLLTVVGLDDRDCCGSQANVCESCDYSRSDSELNCDNKNWCRLPPCSNLHVQVLIVSHNNLISLEDGALSCFYDVTFIDLSSNGIYQIHPAAFQRLSQLRTILLNENRIMYIEPGTFSNIHLAKLTLEDNPLNCSTIENIPRSTNLSELTLPSQCITMSRPTGETATPGHIATTTISDCCGQNNMCQQCEFRRHLYFGVSLDCNFRNWCRVPDCTPMQNGVEELHLEANQITSLQEHSLSCYQDATLINLQQNSIYEIHFTAFQGLSKLQKIWLSYNNITYIESGTFALIPLVELRLYDNPLDCRATENIPLDIESLTLPSQCVTTGHITTTAGTTAGTTATTLAGNVGAATTQVFMSVNFIMVILHVLHITF